VDLGLGTFALHQDIKAFLLEVSSMSHPQWKVAAVPPEFGCYATLTC